MKKRFYVLIFLIALFIGIGNVKAASIEVAKGNGDYFCVQSNGKETCQFKLIVSNGEWTKSIIKISYQLTQLTPDVASSVAKSGWHLLEMTDSYIIVESEKTTLTPGTYDVATLVFDVGGVGCKLVYNGISANRNNYSCEMKYGQYYDKLGRNVTETEYRASCLICKKDESNGKYYGKQGQDLADLAAWNAECDKKYCDYDGINYYDNDGNVISKLKYYEECLKPKCYEVVDGETSEYYDASGNKVSESEYRKSCFRCEINGDNYYGTNGTEVSKIEYSKQCEKHSCEILTDGTRYDKNGKEVNEEDYLKSCFKCHKDNDKYYDENGKETSKENWNIMCTPHKCKAFGNKYFNDKGVLVSAAEYKKACSNPQTGSADIKSISYVISGLLFAGAIVFLSMRYTKLRKI